MSDRIILPLEGSHWEATPGLRWCRLADGSKRLEQVWIGYTIKRGGEYKRHEEWREVPTVELRHE